MKVADIHNTSVLGHRLAKISSSPTAVTVRCTCTFSAVRRSWDDAFTAIEDHKAEMMALEDEGRR